MTHDLDDDNGILAAIPGSADARGSKSLPPAEQHPGAEMAAEVDTGPIWHGMVRIRYRSMEMRHNRHRHWAWISVHAEKVPVDMLDSRTAQPPAYGSCSLSHP